LQERAFISEHDARFERQQRHSTKIAFCDLWCHGSSSALVTIASTIIPMGGTNRAPCQAGFAK
jgi:hypothetical protein